MKKIHVVLIVAAALLPFLIAVIAVVAFIALPISLESLDRTRPVTAVLVYEVDPQSIPPGSPVDMERLVAVVEVRVNRGWRKRARVRQIGPQQIEIGLYDGDPKEAERIDRIVTSSGTLEFRILANDRDHAAIIRQAETEGGDEVRNEAGDRLAWWVPVARPKDDAFPYPEIAKRSVREDGGEKIEILVVGDRFHVNGGYLTRVAEGVDQGARPCLDISFNSLGGKLFSALTANNLPDPSDDFTRKLGIILNGRLHSAPAVQTVVADRAQITGDFTRQEVQELAAILNSGSLPAGLRRVKADKRAEVE